MEIKEELKSKIQRLKKVLDHKQSRGCNSEKVVDIMRHYQKKYFNI